MPASPTLSTPAAVQSDVRLGTVCRAALLALAGLVGATAHAVTITEFYGYRIDPDLGPATVHSIAENDLMTGADSHNQGYVMHIHKPAERLPVPPGFLNVIGYAVDSSGQVTGDGELFVNNHIRVHAFYADLASGTAIDIPPLAGRESQGRTINGSGQVAGNTEGGRRFVTHAFITDPGGQHLRDLGSLAGATGYSTAAGIDARGEVAGSSSTSAGQEHAFLSGPDGGALTDLGTPPDGVESHANGMNEDGVVVGTWQKADGFIRAFITGPEGTPMISLDQFNGLAATPLAVNIAGNVVGGVSRKNNPFAFVTGENGTGYTDLNTITHNVKTKLQVALSINDQGHIVALGEDGYSYVLCPTVKCR